MNAIQFAQLTQDQRNQAAELYAEEAGCCTVCAARQADGKHATVKPDGYLLVHPGCTPLGLYAISAYRLGAIGFAKRGDCWTVYYER